MLTGEASNALLKTLEEPPDRVIFVMATTEPENLEDTIRSRSQHFHFRALTFNEIADRIKYIAKEENLTIADGAVAVIARMAEGSMRDALSLLEQARAYCGEDIPDKAVRELLGVVPEDALNELVEAIAAGSAERALGLVHTFQKEGRNLQHFCREAIRHIRNLLIARVCGGDSDLIAATPDQRPALAKAAEQFSEEDLTRFFNILLQTDDDLRRKPDPRVHLEMGLLRLIHAGRLAPLEELLADLGDANGNPGAIKNSVARASAPATAAQSSKNVIANAAAAGANVALNPASNAAAPITNTLASAPTNFSSDDRGSAGAPLAFTSPAWSKRPENFASASPAPVPPSAPATSLSSQSSPVAAATTPTVGAAKVPSISATTPQRVDASITETASHAQPQEAAQAKLQEAAQAQPREASQSKSVLADEQAELSDAAEFIDPHSPVAEKNIEQEPEDAPKRATANGLSEEQVVEIRGAIQAQQKFLGELLEHAHRWELEGAELRIFFAVEKRAFAEMVEGRDSLEKIRAHAGKVLNRAVRVCAKMETVAATAAKSSQAAAGAKELREKFERDPMVRSMLQRFGGKISEVKRREEVS
jgi:DNA polymerase-3 subunit gamma/tau